MTVALPTIPVRKPRRKPAATNSSVACQLRSAQALQQQMHELEVQLAAHRVWLLSHMQSEGLDRLEIDGFSVQRRIRHNWDYSPETERNALALRNAQKWEQTVGLATDSPTVYIALITKEVK